MVLAFRTLSQGEPAPHFVQRTSANPRFSFAACGGRYLVLAFHHTMAGPGADRIQFALKRPDIFDDRFASLFAISTDTRDEAEARLADRVPGFRVFWDHDQHISLAYGAATAEGRRRGLWAISDPTLRLIDVIPFAEDGSDMDRIARLLDSLPPPARFAGVDLQAPILFLPRVFEQDLCRHLIGLYEAQGGEISGFMRQVDGRTIGVHDPSHKVRRDINLTDPELIARIQTRIARRIVPEIEKIHMFKATRMERYIVSCYDAAEGGHFAPHRDNTTDGTAHRRFAVSINLNDDFDGGEVSFPEYGPRGFKAPAGGAVVFSCALLHTVSRVTQGRRYAFLPFLYDDAAALIRAANLHKIDAGGTLPSSAPK